MSKSRGTRSFPPGTGHVVLPGSPRAAVRQGLALYDSHTRRRRAMWLAGHVSIAIGLGRLLRPGDDRRPAWWEEWVHEVVQPITGPVPKQAIQASPSRIVALLMDASGQPRVFAKLSSDPMPGDSSQSQVLHMLTGDPPATFRVPALVAEGVVAGHRYEVVTAMTDMSLRRGRLSATVLAQIVDELQQKLSALPRPAGSAANHAPAHGDFTHRNVRFSRDGRPWVYDWEDAGWTPRLADELRYWTAEAAYRRVRPVSAAGRILRRLRGRGADAEILEALEWPEFNTPPEQAVRSAMRGLLDAGPDRRATPC
jgi:hypothetical protein